MGNVLHTTSPQPNLRSAACQHQSFLLCCSCCQPENQPLLPALGICVCVFGRGALLLTHLKGLDEGPQEGPDTLTPAQQLHQTHHPEQPEKSDGDTGIVIGVLQAEHNSWRTQSAETSKISRQGGPGPGVGKGNEIPAPGTRHGAFACTQGQTAKMCWHFFPWHFSPQLSQGSHLPRPPCSHF